MSAVDLTGALYTVKRVFLNYFFNFSNGVTLFTVLNIMIFAFGVAVYLKYAIRNKIFNSPLKIAILLGICVFFGIGGTVLAFINAGVDYHNLMLMGYIVYYICFIILYERGEISEGKTAQVRCWGVLIISAILILNQVVISNVSYHKAQVAYEKSYGTIIRIADRIEQLPESGKCDEILVIGAISDSGAYSVELPPDITGITDGYIIRADDETVKQSVLCSALNDYCGKNYKFISGKRKAKLLKKEAIVNMNKWPLRESDAVVDNVIVINLGVNNR
jgi:hypothetical protein